MTDADWQAPILPGAAMLGLTLGASHACVLRAMTGQARLPERVVRFPHSPGIRIRRETGQHGGLTLHAADADEALLASLWFDLDALTDIAVYCPSQADPLFYSGELCRGVGLGRPVAALECLGTPHFDADEEIFTVPGLPGIQFGGGSCVSLHEDPAQIITWIRVLGETTAG